MKLKHSSEIIDGLELKVPFFGISYLFKQACIEESRIVRIKRMFLVEVGEVLKLDIGNSLSFESFIFFLWLFEESSL